MNKNNRLSAHHRAKIPGDNYGYRSSYGNRRVIWSETSNDVSRNHLVFVFCLLCFLCLLCLGECQPETALAQKLSQLTLWKAMHLRQASMWETDIVSRKGLVYYAKRTNNRNIGNFLYQMQAKII